MANTPFLFQNKLSILKTIIKSKQNHINLISQNNATFQDTKLSFFIFNIAKKEVADNIFTVLETVLNVEQALSVLNEKYKLLECNVCIIELWHLNEIALECFRLFTEGRGRLAVGYVNYDERVVVRPFERITDDDLMNYGSEECGGSGDGSGGGVAEDVVKGFMRRMCENNYSTAGNVVEILKKIGNKMKKRENIMTENK